MTGKEVKELRTRAGMTQQEFSTALGLGISTVQKWEAGKNPSKMANNLLKDFEKTLINEDNK